MPPLQPPQQDTLGELKRLRTYQSDVEELMHEQNISKATIALSENERRIKEEVEAVQETQTKEPAMAPTETKIFAISTDIPQDAGWNLKPLIIIIAILLLFGGIGVGIFFRFFANPPGSEGLVVTVHDTQATGAKTVNLGEGERRSGALSLLQASITTVSVPQNEIRIIPIVQGNTAVTTSKLFSILEVNAPSSLIRALGETPTLGIHGFKGGQPFWLWNVSSYDHAFAGMLSWEPKLLDDMGPIFGISSREILKKVGSTTAEALQNTIAVKDVIIRNKDVRAVFGPDGTIVFLYSFIDKQTLVVTTNEETLKMLIGKAGGGHLK